jgi:UTP:GlnB (protein PII) uridylyltransferase
VIHEQEVEAAVDWLRDTANEAAQKRAERLYLDEYRKVLRAKLMKQHMDLPVSAQEREALADPKYAEHLQALKTAIDEDERMRFLRVAAEAKIEAWRSMNANHRAIKV